MSCRYLTPTKDHWAADIEADNLLDKATRIWCLCVSNVLAPNTTVTFTRGEDFLEWQKENPNAIFVGHNFLAYDAPMLNKFWGAKIGVSRVVDTYVLSQMYNPKLSIPMGMYPKGAARADRKGPHSLEAWGHRLRHPKLAHKDFSFFSPEMLVYCQNDVSLTKKLFLKLTERMRQFEFTEVGCEIEHLAWNIIQNKQKRTGFPFDYEKAHKLYVSLRAREDELKEEIYKLWPPELQCVATYRRAFKADGSPTRLYETHLGQFPKLEVEPDGTYRAYDYVSFGLGSPAQRVEKLLQLGWVPTEFTKRTPKGGGGNPKVDEESLLNFAEVSGRTELLALAKWIVINSRANTINSWMEVYNYETRALHGSLFLASTLRYRHRDPNGANIPAVRLKKGEDGEESIQYGEAGGFSYEARDLFTCGEPTEWSLVGIDGTGIQNRCLIHNLIKTVGEERVRDFKALALSGDIHRHNIEVLGLANKAAAKKFYYSLMMGGGGALLAADQAQFGTKMTAKEGEEKKKAMIASMPGFGALIRSLQDELSSSGRIKLCDGTPVLVPSPHMVIPYLLQGDESRLMKKAMIFVDEEIRRRKLQKDILKVADIHDEWQYKVRKQYVEAFIEFALPCFIKAGEFFNYLIEITGDAKVGRTWAETH